MANEFYKNDDSVGGYNAGNYCVLTYDGSVQYSRIEGFLGEIYTWLRAAVQYIMFSSVNSGGTPEIKSANLSATDAVEEVGNPYDDEKQENLWRG